MARDNRTLGRFHLAGLPPAPRGMPQIEVAFDIDANGLVNVTAKDRATNTEQKVTITGSSGLSKEEVDRMVRDAEAHAADDRSRKEIVEARNNADALAYSVEKTLGENREKLPAADVARIESAIATVRSATAGEDAGAITRAADELQRASHAMAEALYTAQAGNAGAGARQAAEPDVVDAEVVEK
jgi:molecular chaperone DnaK